MKRKLSAAWMACVAMAISPALPARGVELPKLQEGDIVFSGSARGQGEAIIAATRSPYTHCGIVFQKDGKLMVLEAVQPVGMVPLEVFMSRGDPAAFAARRLKNPLAPADYQRARAWAVRQIGKNYDGRFLWDDGDLYCSELVWKIYQHAGVELCEPKRFKDYQLDHPEVRKIIEERHGGIARLPMEEKVVAPSDLAASLLLTKVPD